MNVKQAPLTTFLGSVASQSGEPNAPTTPSATSVSPAQTLVLTVLSQADGPTSRGALTDHFAKSDLKADACEQALQGLESSGLINQVNSGYVLTDRGLKVAEQVRARLLSPW